MTTAITFVPMKAFLILLLALGLLAATGCQTNKGSREYVPGRGWVPTR